MKVDPNSVVPSQNFLKPETVRQIFENIDNNDLESLPPPPVVREDEAGRLVAIDGHNLLAVMSYLGQEVDVYVAASANDTMVALTEAEKARKAVLEHKFHETLARRQQVQAQGIDSFADLIAKHQDLFPK